MSPARHRIGRLFLVLAAVLAPAPAALAQGTLQVVSHTPAKNALGVAPTSTVSVTFDRPVDAASFAGPGFRVYGKWSGPKAGPFILSNLDRTVTLTPGVPFSSGELVTVNLSRNLRAADGSFLRSAGYAFQFMVRTQARGLGLLSHGVLQVRDVPTVSTRAYGGSASDFNEDGRLDLGIVNEDTGDLRLFLNQGGGQFGPLVQPPTPIGLGTSPNEPGDYDNDGHADLAATQYSINRFSVVLGNGNATFGPPQTQTVPSVPAGLAVLDVDGDADWDAVTASVGGNTLALLLNNAGVFGAPASFEGGGNGEYGVAAGDMNGDGILDLVVGTQLDSSVRVRLGNGNGTFSPAGSAGAGGAVWMVALGDLNGDGWLDVTTANGGTGNGATLLGNGDGTLQAAVTRTCGGSCVATDLGDLDGDGDLDWILSSYGAAQFRLLTNAGGIFTLDRTLPAPAAGSCAVPFDFDEDGDLDLALIDELADQVLLWRNVGRDLVFGNGFQ
jgi:hypothetical protein